jgi:hypothetical protein
MLNDVAIDQILIKYLSKMDKKILATLFFGVKYKVNPQDMSRANRGYFAKIL